MKQILLIALVALIVVSCKKNTTTTTNDDMSNLMASSSFNWETSRNVNFTIETNYATVISITSINGNTVFHKGYFNRSKPSYNIIVSLPAFLETVLVNGYEVDIYGDMVTVDLSYDESKDKKTKTVISADKIAYWEFNENSGNVAYDSESDNNGIITGSEWVTGINGSALDFDGDGGHVQIENNDELNITSDKVSWSVWFKKNAVDDDGCFIFNNTKYIMRMDKFGRVMIAVYNPGFVAASMTWSQRIIDTDWHNAVATYDGSQLKLFIDTKLMASTETSGNLKSSRSDTYIGNQNTINDFNGILDQVAIFADALTVEDIENIYQNTPDTEGSSTPVSYWKLDEGSGTIAYDSEGNNNGNIAGGKWVEGVSGYALNFNGINQCVTVPNSEDMNFSGEITILAWAKTMENKTSKIAQKGDWDGHGIYQDKWNGWKCSIRSESNSSYSINWGNGIPVFDQWYHIAMTYDGQTMKLYINGQLMNQESVGENLHINSRPFSIGSDNGSQKFFNGTIDDVRLYNTSLSQTEIQFIYNNPDNTGVTDADGDGVQDSDDDYPNDPARAFNNFLPASDYGSLVFEDLWPGTGDYDFNDLVLDYQFNTITNVNNNVAEIRGIFVIRAIGAGLRNGFGFQFPDNIISESDIMVSGYNIDDGYISLGENGLEEGQNNPTFIVFDNANNIMPSNSSFGVNVDPDAEYVDPDTLVLSIVITPDKYSSGDFDLENFNPFLIVDKERGKEIHLANYPPTTLADENYFGTMDDTSDPASSRYYKTANNLPWALKIAESYDYTIEKTEITSAYTKFYEWANSGGVLYPDWYLEKAGYRNESNIYQIPE